MIIAKEKWNEIDSSNFLDEKFSHLIGVEELTDYELINYQSKQKVKLNTAKKVAKKKQRLQQDVVAQNASTLQWIESFKFLPTQICDALSALGFSEPTPVQKAVIPYAHKGINILASAQTGSGKTLAFLIPIITKLLTNSKETSKKIQALIITPTRELALQIKSHAISLSKFTPLKIVTLVGGMSIQKQERLLKQHPNILIATPGRLKDLLSLYGSAISKFGDDPEQLQELDNRYIYKTANFDVETLVDFRSLQFLVMDEADKMVTAGHWRDVKSILIHLKNLWVNNSLPPQIQVFIISATLNIPYNTFKNNLQLPVKTRNGGKYASKSSPRAGKFENASKISIVKKFKRLFTSLPFTLVVKRGKRSSSVNAINDSKRSKSSNVPEFHVVDLSPVQITVPTLEELRVTCLNFDEKDIYLYYFLTVYLYRHHYCNTLIEHATEDSKSPEVWTYKVLIFCNSIDCVRRLHGLFSLLLNPRQTISPNCPSLLPNTSYAIYRLHASMSQRDRLKCMDKFSSQFKPSPDSASNSIKSKDAFKTTIPFHVSCLFATDLAARGIDLESTLDCVVHYEMSETFAGFIHRCGRTARAGRSGLSLAMITPDQEGLKYDKYVRQRAMKTIDIKTINEPSKPLMGLLKERTFLADKIENLQHQTAKSSRQFTWAQKVTHAFELESNEGSIIDSDDSDTENNVKSEKNDTRIKNEIEKLKRKLKFLLSSTSLLRP